MAGWLSWGLILTLVWIHYSMNEETTVLTFKWQPLNRKIEDLTKMFPVSANTLASPLERDLTELTLCQRFKLESLVTQIPFTVNDSSNKPAIFTMLEFGLMGNTGQLDTENLFKLN
jgi:hypothetical protein